MANLINLYANGPTAGANDGELIDSAHPLAPEAALLVGSDSEGGPIKCAVRTVDGKQHAGSLAIELVGISADRWALAPDDAGAPGAWAAWGAALTLTGPVTARNTVFWAKARVTADETIVGSSQDDTSVMLRVPQDIADAVVPLFTAGPALARGDASVTLTASWSDGGDGEAVTAKRIVKTSSTEPSEADWASASSFTSPETISGLTNGTPVYAWVRITDASGDSVTSGPVSATPAVNTAPVFDAGPTVTGAARTSATLSAVFHDPDGDTVTATYRVVTAGGTPNWTGAPAFTNPQALTGLSASTSYDAYVQLNDGNGHVVTSGPVTFSTVADAAPTFSTPATVSAIQATSVTVTAAATDADGDVVTYKVAVTASPSPPSDWSSYPVRSHAEITAGVQITGLTGNTAYYAHVHADDGLGATAVSTSSQFTTKYTWSGLVATFSPRLWYRLNEASGTTAADASGNGRDGTFVGLAPTFQQTSLLAGDTANKATKFNATATVGQTSSRINAPTASSVLLARPYTLLTWFKLASLPSTIADSMPAILVDGNTAGAAYFVLGLRPTVASTTARLEWGQFGGANTGYKLATSGDINVGPTYMAAAVITASSVKLFLNASQVYSDAVGTSVDGQANFYVGSRADDSNVNRLPYAFNGTLDEVLVLPSALSASDITNLYAAGSGT